MGPAPSPSKIALNSKEEISMWSRLTFWWLYPILKTGTQRPLEREDLVPITSSHSSSLLGDLVQNYWDQEFQSARWGKRKPSFVRAIFKCFSQQFFLFGMIAFVEECIFRTAGPIFLGLLIRYFNNEEGFTDNMGYVFTALIILCYFGALLCHHPYFFGVQLIGMKIRISASALIYRKALRLSTTAIRNTTVGQMVNLLSNDVNRFDNGVCFLNFLWIGPLQSVITTIILWHEIGPSCLAGMILIMFYVPLQSYMGKKFSKLRLKIAERTDERVRLMHEIVTAIRVIKMYAWEKPFKIIMEKARKLEIDTIMKSNYLRAVNLTLFITASKVVCFISFLVYILSGNVLTAEKVFVTISLMNNVRLTMTLFFYYAISQGSECLISCKRIQAFLEMEEKPLRSNNTLSNLRPKTEKCRLTANGIFAKWSPLVSDDHLKNVSFDVKAGELLTLIGPVGSGKSSLIQAILGELPLREGTIKVQGRISYASQETWIFSGTVRENILFGQPYFAKRYSRVVKVCALEKDFELFDEGDQTMVGERGLNLSGGQRARINLARAVYFDADVYLLDDPLSAVDAHVGRHLFEQCITQFLSSKIVILATHQQQFIQTAHQIIVLRNGYVEAQGTYSEIKNQGIDFSLILDEEEDERRVDKEKPALLTVVPKSIERNGSLITNITRLRRASENWGSLCGSTGDLSDMGLENRSLFGAQGCDGSLLSLQKDDLYGPYEPEVKQENERNLEAKATGSISFSIYIKYFVMGVGWLMFFFLVIAAIVSQVAFVGTDYWLSYWTEKERQVNSYTVINETAGDANLSFHFEDRTFYVYTYAGIILALLSTSMMRSVIFFYSCMATSTKLHNNMFGAVIQVPVAFFETHPIGQILNRFTKDTGQVDDLLPPAMFDFLAIFMNVFASVIMIVYLNVWIVIPCIVLAGCFAFVRWVYISSSRDIKRIEGITRSPVFSHLSSTFEGLTTIRAFQTELSASIKFDDHQDLHTSSWVMYISSARLFGIYLDFLSAVFIAVVTISFLLMSAILGGNAGLGISLAITLSGGLQWGFRQSAEVESHMTSVERIIEYSNLSPEESVQTVEKKPRVSGWPNKGKVNFQNVYLYYKEDESPVLKDLTFTIYPGEKIGIVGRTGAGKSSLISCLFRLTNPKGTILIDDVATDSLSLEDLRKSISIIPQDPTLFSGTVRRNLDPFLQYSDDDIWNALEEVNLKSLVTSMEDGLQSAISEGGGNLSIGQRQLVCLARAILKHNKILVMDEATANVDPRTDSWIQQTIREKFVDCTVLTIAHRLNTIMDSDRIMVMDAGTLKEFAQPHIMLKDPDSLLSLLVEQTGTASAVHLREVAYQAYMSKEKNDHNFHDNVRIIVSSEESDLSGMQDENTRL